MAEMIEFTPDEIPGISAEELLDSLTLGVMKNNIIQQIRGKVSSQQNFLSIVIEKFEIIEDNVEDPDVKRQLQYEIIDFCRELILEIVDFYNLFYDDNLGSSMKVIEILTVLYNFFIIRSEEFVCTFFINYIQQHKTKLLDEIGITRDIANITAISNEKKNIRRENIVLLSNIDKVISFIANNNVDPMEFLQTINDGDFYVNTLQEYFMDDLVTGDFANQYIMQFVDDYSSKKSTEVRNNIQAAFMN